MTRLTSRGEYVAATAGVAVLIGVMWIGTAAGTWLVGPDPAPQTATAEDVRGEAHQSVVVPTPTATRVAPRATPSAASRTRPLVQPPRPVESGTRLSSTAYCETGVMANGQHTRRGVVAGNRWKLGTVLHVSDSPYGPGDFTVLDHIGHGSDLDFAMPGDCAGARQWGRRTVRAQVIR